MHIHKFLLESAAAAVKLLVCQLHANCTLAAAESSSARCRYSFATVTSAQRVKKFLLFFEIYQGLYSHCYKEPLTNFTAADSGS